jgi:hypothetical protein
MVPLKWTLLVLLWLLLVGPRHSWWAVPSVVAGVPRGEVSALGLSLCRWSSAVSPIISPAESSRGVGGEVGPLLALHHRCDCGLGSCWSSAGYLVLEVLLSHSQCECSLHRRWWWISSAHMCSQCRFDSVDEGVHGDAFDLLGGETSLIGEGLDY